MTQENIERRLAAILLADVVSYSRLMGENEEGTLRALQSHRINLIDPTIGQFQGRIVKLMGDGVLVEFPSIVNAVECGIAIQKGMVARNKNIPDDNQIKFRIGINLGDILIDGDDIYGDGINIAARLEALSEPYGVCISNSVYTQIDGVLEHEFTDLGAHALKNISKPVRAYHHKAAPDLSTPKSAFRPFIDPPVEKPSNITGGCLCGAVQFEISKADVGTMYCHCRMCQKFTGSPVMAGTTFPIAAVKYTVGLPKYYQSSNIAKRGFCSDCGSSLLYQGTVGQWTEWVLILTACLDDPGQFVPSYHLGVESTIPWHTVQDELPRTRCEDSPSLIQAYAAAKKQTLPR